MTKNKPFVIIFVTILLVFFAVTRESVKNVYTEHESDSSIVKISASFYPLAHFAQQTVGDNVNIITITPNNTEPHDFEPSPQDILKIRSSDIFIFNGSNFDPWAEKIANEIKDNGVIVINMTSRLDSNINDPHTWLDSLLAKKSVEIIRDELKLINPNSSDTYDYNTEIYLEKLTNLDARYRNGLKNCELRNAIASHGAFGYLSDRYKINIISISGNSPDKEPSAKEMGEIIKFARAEKIKHIFSEPLVSPKLAETIANEIDAEVLTLNPIETLTEKEAQNGENYISIMNNNLYNLRTALRCQ